MPHYARFEIDTGDLSTQNHSPGAHEVNCLFWEIEEGTNPNMLYVYDGELFVYPPKPSDHKYWQFNKAEKVWQDNRTIDQLQSDFESAQDKAIKSINAAIGDVRGLYITDIVGQEMAYLDKQREAEAYIAESLIVDEPDITQYPFIMNEVGLTASDAYQLAQIWLNSADYWRQIAAAMEKLRFATIKTVENAARPDEISDIVAEFKVSLQAFVPSNSFS